MARPAQSPSLPTESNRPRGHLHRHGVQIVSDNGQRRQLEEAVDADTAEGDDDDAELNEDDTLNARADAHSYSEDSVSDVPDWDPHQLRTHGSPNPYSNHRQVTYIDEETRVRLHYRQEQGNFAQHLSHILVYAMTGRSFVLLSDFTFFIHTVKIIVIRSSCLPFSLFIWNVMINQSLYVAVET